MELKEYFENIKNELKEHSKFECSLKSISFSIDIENKKFNNLFCLETRKL